MQPLPIATFATVAGLSAGQFLTMVAAVTAPLLDQQWGLALSVAVITAGLATVAVSVGWFTRSRVDAQFSPSGYRTLVTLLNVTGVAIFLAFLSGWVRDAGWEIGMAIAMLVLALYAGLRRRPTREGEPSSGHLVNHLWVGVIALGVAVAAAAPLSGVVVQNLVAGVALTFITAGIVWMSVLVRSMTHKAWSVRRRTQRGPA